MIKKQHSLDQSANCKRKYFKISNFTIEQHLPSHLGRSVYPVYLWVYRGITAKCLRLFDFCDDMRSSFYVN